MRITLELSDTQEQVDVELPAIPRIGEQILWTDSASDEHGPYDRMREYRVGMVDWTMRAGSDGGPFILLRCDFLADVSGAPPTTTT